MQGVSSCLLFINEIQSKFWILLYLFCVEYLLIVEVGSSLSEVFGKVAGVIDVIAAEVPDCSCFLEISLLAETSCVLDFLTKGSEAD